MGELNLLFSKLEFFCSFILNVFLVFKFLTKCSWPNVSCDVHVASIDPQYWCYL